MMADVVFTEDGECAKIVVLLGGPHFKPTTENERKEIYNWSRLTTEKQLSYLRLDALGLVHYAVLGAARLRPKATSIRTAVLA